MFKFSLSYINENSRVSKIFLKKSIELTPKQKSHLIIRFIIVLAVINLPIKNIVANRL